MFQSTIYSITLIISACLVWLTTASADHHLTSVRTQTTPTVDELASDDAWRLDNPIVINNGAADIPLTLRSVHSDGSIYFRVSNPDAGASRRHRPWVWNPDAARYEVGPERTDPVGNSIRTRHSPTAVPAGFPCGFRSTFNFNA